MTDLLNSDPGSITFLSNNLQFNDKREERQGECTVFIDNRRRQSFQGQGKAQRFFHFFPVALASLKMLVRNLAHEDITHTSLQRQDSHFRVVTK